MFCSNCGNAIKDTAQFCEHCGTETALSAPRAAATTPEAPAAKNKTPWLAIFAALFLVFAFLAAFLVKGGVNLDHFGGAKVDQLVKW